MAASLMVREARDAEGRVELQHTGCRTVWRVGLSLHDLAPRLLVTCACGNSDHATTYLRYLVEVQLGALGASLSPSVS